MYIGFLPYIFSGNDARRNRAAVKVLKEGYLFKERPPPPLPPGERLPYNSSAVGVGGVFV